MARAHADRFSNPAQIVVLIDEEKIENEESIKDRTETLSLKEIKKRQKSTWEQ